MSTRTLFDTTKIQERCRLALDSQFLGVPDLPEEKPAEAGSDTANATPTRRTPRVWGGGKITVEELMLKRLPQPSTDYVQPAESDDARRRSLGIYYTPRTAASLLAKWAIRGNDDTVLEPSFGGCTLLEAAVDRLRALGCAHPVNQIFGFDVDESAFGHLRRLLGNNHTSQFVLQDFLTVLPGHLHVNTVIANPPFVSYHRMNDAQRSVVRTWRRQHAPPFAMTASLWAYFLAHSISFLNTGGRLAFVLPFAASSSDYAQPIMRLLREQFATLALYRVREQLFTQAGADERTVVLLAETYLGRTSDASQSLVRSVASLGELDRALSEDREGTPAVAAFDVSTASADRVNEALHRATSQGSLCQLGDVMDVTIGEVVGDTAYFVKSADEWQELAIPERYLRPIVTRMRQVAGLRVTREPASSLYSAIPFLLAPPASRIQKTIRDYLEGYPSGRLLRNKTFAKRSPWYSVSYDPTASAFIGSMAQRSPKIVWNSAGISCTNGLYKLFRKKGTSWRSLLSAASLTTVFQVSAEMLARVRGAGALKLEPRDVRKLLIPAHAPSLDAPSAQQLFHRLDALVRRGEHESATRIADDIFYLSAGVLSRSELTMIRSRLQDLRGERLPSKRLSV